MKGAKRPFWKLLLLCLLADAAGFGLLYLFEVLTLIPPVMVKYTLLASLGVLTGLFARYILGRHSGMFRLFGGAFTVVTALWLTDWRTGGFVGIAPIDLNHPYPGWDGILQLFAVWSVMILALRAWKRKPKPAPAPVLSRPEPIPAAQPVLSTQVYAAIVPQLQTAGGVPNLSSKPQFISDALAPIISQLKTWPALGRPVKKSANPVPRDLPQPVIEITPPAVREPVILPPQADIPFEERKTAPLPKREHSSEQDT